MNVEIGFERRRHPHLRIYVEDEKDLSSCYRTTLLQGAFMGDAILRLPTADFSSRDGWRGLIEWSLRLDALHDRMLAKVSESEISDPNSDQKIHVTLEGGVAFLSRDPRGRRVGVDEEQLAEAVSSFLGETMAWVGSNYPAALRNPNASDIWERLARY